MLQKQRELLPSLRDRTRGAPLHAPAPDREETHTENSPGV